MARIAVGGFHHETNCFVAERTDFAYFASHRDRPPLVRGADVIEWLGDTSFALSGFLRDMRARHEIVPLLWTSGGAGGLVTRGCLRADRGRAGRAAVGGDAGRRRLPRPARRHGAASRSRTARASCCAACAPPSGPSVPIAISLDYHSNVTPEMVEHTDSLVAYRTYPHVDRPETGQFAARAMSAPARARPPRRARAAQAAVPDPAQRPVHAGRAVEGAWSPARWWPRASWSTSRTSPASRPPISTGAGRP